MAKESIRTVMYGSREICYTLVRKKVKNINLRIYPGGSITVSAPRIISAQRIDAFVQSKGSYILSAIEKLGKAAKTEPPKYEPGDRIRLLGKDLTLVFLQGEKSGAVMNGDILTVTVKDTSDTAKKQRQTDRFVDELCRDVFLRSVERMLPALSKYGVKMPAVKVRQMKSRWGSCLVNKGTVTLNRRLIEKPISCIDYVAAHELCHFVHPNHSKAFYALLGEVMPDWKAQKELLNK